MFLLQIHFEKCVRSQCVLHTLRTNQLSLTHSRVRTQSPTHLFGSAVSRWDDTRTMRGRGRGRWMPSWLEKSLKNGRKGNICHSTKPEKSLKFAPHIPRFKNRLLFASYTTESEIVWKWSRLRLAHFNDGFELFSGWKSGALLWKGRNAYPSVASLLRFIWEREREPWGRKEKAE